MKQLRDTVIEDQELNLGGPDVWYLGHNLVLRNCDITIRVSARRLIVARVLFDSCRIHVPGKLVNFRWNAAVMQNCTLSGHYSGCDFGYLPAFYDDYGGFSSCDLSRATMHGCRYFDCDMSTIALPPWPHFTVLSPLLHYSHLKALQLPQAMEVAIGSLRSSPPSTTGATLSAVEIARRYPADPVDLEGLRGRLGGLEYIVIPTA